MSIFVVFLPPIVHINLDLFQRQVHSLDHAQVHLDYKYTLEIIP